MLIRQKIDNCRMREFQDVSRHIINMKEIRKEGEEIGYIMSDQEFKLAFFMSLPASWKTFITQQMGCHDMNTIYAEAEVHQQFHKSHDRMLNSSNNQRRDFARLTNANRGAGCSNCGYKNHEYKDCYREGGGKRRRLASHGLPVGCMVRFSFIAFFLSRPHLTQWAFLWFCCTCTCIQGTDTGLGLGLSLTHSHTPLPVDNPLL